MESTTSYRLLFERNPSPMWVFDVETLRIVDVNDAAIREYGYSREEFLTLTLRDIRPRDDVSLLEETIQNLTEEPHMGVYRHCRRDGSIIDVEVTGDAITFENRPARLVMANNVTSRLAAEREAERLSNALRQTLDCITDGFLLLDDNWRIRFLNGRAKQVLLSKDQDLIGRNVWETFPLARGTEFEREYRRAMLGQRPVQFESDYPPLNIRLDVRAYPTQEGLAIYFRDITEEWRTREQLRQVDERFRLLVQATTDCTWDHDVATGKVWVNDTFIEVFGGADNLTTFEEWLELIHPDDQERVRAGALRLWEGGSSWAEEYRIRRRDGTYVYVMDRGHVHRGPDGAPRRILGVMTDLSERKKAELETARINRTLQMHSRSTELLLRAENEAELVGAICRIAVDTGGFHLAWVGYASDDDEKTVRPIASAGEGRAYLDNNEISWDDTRSNGRGPCGRVLRSGEAIVVPDLEEDVTYAPWIERARTAGLRSAVCLPLRQGERTFGVLMLFRTEPYEMTPDELAHTQCLADDLAIGIAMHRARVEGMRTQEAIREQAALIDEASDAICVRDLSHRIVFWSKGAERLYGWTADEVRGQRFDAALHIDPTAFAEAERNLLSEGSWSGEIQKLNRSGSALMLNARWTLLRDADGRPKSILSIDTDITEQKQLEERAMRVQRLESLGTLAGGIAHDLNNLLAPIMMAVALLRRRLRDPSVLPLIANIERSAERGKRLVAQVLSFARGADGSRAVVHVQAIVEEVESIIASTFPKSIVVQATCDPSLWPVKGDQTQLCQVLMNLCVNARDAMPTGGTLSIKVSPLLIDARFAGKHPGASTGPHVLLEVTDTGCGIRKRDLQRIFEPFFTNKPLGEGTGLGLATSLSIVRSHGGFIDVLSEIGEGSTFRVYLPAEPALSDNPATPVLDDNPITFANGELVLLVDDEQDILTVAREALESFGYQVITACDGVHALADYALNQHRIAAVVTDLMMPVMDGVAVIETVRRMNRDIPVIVTSGLDAGKMLTNASRAGMTSFLAKPYTAEALLERLSAALQAAERSIAAVGSP